VQYGTILKQQSTQYVKFKSNKGLLIVKYKTKNLNCTHSVTSVYLCSNPKNYRTNFFLNNHLIRLYNLRLNIFGANKIFRTSYEQDARRKAGKLVFKVSADRFFQVISPALFYILKQNKIVQNTLN
jgi:hypothetical protein